MNRLPARIRFSFKFSNGPLEDFVGWHALNLSSMIFSKSLFSFMKPEPLKLGI